LYPDQYNLTKSRWHLEQTEAIDRDFCDVNQQFAHVAVQEQKYPEFEERLLQSLMCPYTMQGAIGMWQQYWNIQLDATQNSAATVRDNEKRYNSYKAIIDKAIADDAAAQDNKREERKSPLAINWKK
jgi:hypothetical protein